MDINVIVFIIVQVIIIDGILSLDNAAVLGAMATKLSPDVPAPLPPRLRRMLGKNQQEAALKVGLFGAYIGRSLMLLLGGVILAFPILKVLGAFYLFNLVAGHFEISEKIDRRTKIFTFLGKITEPIKTLPGRLRRKNNARFSGSSHQRLIASPFWRVVITVEIMDLVFSLDNVIAILALSEHIAVVIIGVCISILIMRFAATQFLKLINLEPSLVHAAYFLILAIGIELILKYFNLDIEELVQFAISMAIIITFILIGGAKRIFGRLQSAKALPEVEYHLDQLQSIKEENRVEHSPDQLQSTKEENRAEHRLHQPQPATDELQVEHPFNCPQSSKNQTENHFDQFQPPKYEAQAKQRPHQLQPATDGLIETDPYKRHSPPELRKTVLESTHLGDTNTMPFINTYLRC